MRVPRLTWGSGPRTAVLVHGYSDDADTWWQVGPALAARGWTVHAPDLLGHGLAPRAHRYQLADVLGDLIDSVGRGVDLVLGHSLGALLVNIAGEAIDADRVVLVDPPWGELPRDRGRARSQDVELLAQLSPGWSAEDVRVDARSNARLDPTMTAWVAGDPLQGQALPLPPLLPTLVVTPAMDPLVPYTRHDELRGLGFDLLVVPDVGHVVHRDDPALIVDLCASRRTRDLPACAP